MAKGKPTSRDRQAQETKNRIFSVASQLIIEKGFDNVTLEEISKKAGIAKGLFYHYFKSKSDLIIETYGIVDSDFEKELMDLDVNTSPMDKIFFTVNTMARYAKRLGMDFVKQLYKGQLDTVSGFFIRKERPFFKTIHDSIVVLQERGVIGMEIDPYEYTHLIMAIARGVLYDWCLQKGNYDVEAAMDTCFRKIVYPEQKWKRK